MGFFFFNDTATTEIYTLSLHDALPIPDTGYIDVPNPASGGLVPTGAFTVSAFVRVDGADGPPDGPGSIVSLADRKSTRLNSSHANISYAVFCLKKKILASSFHLTLSLY